jgi:Holliday junction resolvasome RuvABC endonuclease subunit
MSRKQMQKPTKQQIIDRLNHFENHVVELIEQLKSGMFSLENVFPYLDLAVKGAPSLEPVVKAEDTTDEATV